MRIFRYSICHPDKEKIEKPSVLLDRETAQNFFEEYSWEKSLALFESLDDKNIFFYPSLGFENTQDSHSVSVSLIGSNNSGLEFSFWVIVPIEKKILWGLLGSRKVTKVFEKWNMKKRDVRLFLIIFLEGNYSKLLGLMSPEYE